MTIYKWHREISQIYGSVIAQLKTHYKIGKWMGQQLACPSLESVDSSKEAKIESDRPDSIAWQFYKFMPGHSFKVEHLLNQLKFVKTKSSNVNFSLPLDTEGSSLVVIDIGCGGATATTAILNYLAGTTFKHTRILFIGVDVNPYAIKLYEGMLKQLVQLPRFQDSESSGSLIDYRMIVKGLPDAFTYVATGIEDAKKKWNLPSLSDLWIIQANVVRPLSNLHSSDVEKQDSYQFDPPKGLISRTFGTVEAEGYEQLLRLTQADRIAVLSVATSSDLQSKVHSMGDAISEILEAKGSLMGSRYPVDWQNRIPIKYENPHSSLFYNPNSPEYENKNFYGEIVCAESASFLADEDWIKIISPDNLYLAWVRVRAAMMQDALTDEIAIMEFDVDASSRLATLRDQLLTYTVDVNNFPRFSYEVPKNERETRKRGLQTIEEEVLAIAVIQVLGIKIQNVVSHTYAYHISSDRTEFFYRFWRNAYRKYTQRILKTIQGHDEDVAVLRTDIRTFFNDIPQLALFDIATKLFQSERNKRIKWLLRQLIVRPIDKHEPKHGLMQGPLQSGFLANLYLLSMEQQFTESKFDDIYFFRYVDDVVFVAPESKIDSVKAQLDDYLVSLELERSEEKTETLDKNAAIEDFKRDEELDKIEKEARPILHGLYYLNPQYHLELRKANNTGWWAWISAYAKCLSAIGIYIETTQLSRKVWQYINGAIFSNEKYSMPSFLTVNNDSEWSRQFHLSNSKWINKKEAVKQKLSNLFSESWNEWQHTSDDKIKKRLQSRITFSLNRLALLGYEYIVTELVEIFYTAPFLLKAHKIVLSSLARQQQRETLEKIWDYIQDATFLGASHVRAVWFYALRYLDQQWTHLVDILLRYSLNFSSAHPEEMLMASETLIKLKWHPTNRNQAKSILRSAKEHENQHPRIARNLVLLVSQSQIYSVSPIDLGSLNLSFELGQNELWEKRQSETDSEDVRTTFYSSRYPDWSDGFEGDYF